MQGTGSKGRLVLWRSGRMQRGETGGGNVWRVQMRKLKDDFFAPSANIQSV